MAETYVAAIDQGTTSTRCLLFDRKGRMVSVAQLEHRHHFPQPGWVEHDATEVWRNVTKVVPEPYGRPASRSRRWPPSGSRTSVRRPSCGIPIPAGR